MDPSKLKVVELRAALAERGLDTKGNKPVLVERLRKALEEEEEEETATATTQDCELRLSTESLPSFPWFYSRFRIIVFLPPLVTWTGRSVLPPVTWTGTSTFL